MDITQEEWIVIDSGGRVMLKAVGEPQIICTLETVPLKISPKVHSRAELIAAAPETAKQRDELLEACKALVANIQGYQDGTAMACTLDVEVIEAAIAAATN